MTFQVKIRHNVVVSGVLLDLDLAPLDQPLGLLVGEGRAAIGSLAQIALVFGALGAKQ